MSDPLPIHAAVLTISDSCFQGLRDDLSGPAVQQGLAAGGFEVTLVRTLPDERSQIASALRELADSSKVNLIFTTGGTGVAPRDVTPEATRDVIDREIPGIGELVRSIGRKRIRMAPLTRAIGGIRGTTLIINLPGSPGGAVQSLNAILELVPHAIDLISGRTNHPPVNQPGKPTRSGPKPGSVTAKQ